MDSKQKLAGVKNRQDLLGTVIATSDWAAFFVGASLSCAQQPCYLCRSTDIIRLLSSIRGLITRKSYDYLTM